jgi:hypothetical protein
MTHCLQSHLMRKTKTSQQHHFFSFTKHTVQWFPKLPWLVACCVFFRCSVISVVSFPELTLLSNFKEENLIVCETLSSVKNINKIGQEHWRNLAKNIEETRPKLGQNFKGIFEVLGQVLQSSWKSSSKFFAKFFNFLPMKFWIFIRMIRTNKKFFEDANFPGSPIATMDNQNLKHMSTRHRHYLKHMSMRHGHYTVSAILVSVIHFFSDLKIVSAI